MRSRSDGGVGVVLEGRAGGDVAFAVAGGAVTHRAVVAIHFAGLREGGGSGFDGVDLGGVGCGDGGLGGGFGRVGGGLLAERHREQKQRERENRFEHWCLRTCWSQVVATPGRADFGREKYVIASGKSIGSRALVVNTG